MLISQRPQISGTSFSEIFQYESSYAGIFFALVGQHNGKRTRLQFLFQQLESLTYLVFKANHAWPTNTVPAPPSQSNTIEFQSTWNLSNDVQPVEIVLHMKANGNKVAPRKGGTFKTDQQYVVTKQEIKNALRKEHQNQSYGRR